MSSMSVSPATSSSIVTNEVPVVNGDILRSTRSPSVSPTRTTVSARRGSIAEAVGIDLNTIGKAEARKVMSEEHKVLGFRPPQGSLAAEVQAAAAKHPEVDSTKAPDPATLKELARQDAVRILSERKVNIANGDPPAAKANSNGKPAKVSPPIAGMNLSTISAVEARTLMSHEHRALGFRPPPGSLAAEAQAAAAKHPEGAGNSTIDPGLLKEIAVRDAERIKADRELNIAGEVNVSTIGKAGVEPVAAATEHEQHSPPLGSLPAEAKNATAEYPNGGSFFPVIGNVHKLEELSSREGEKLKTQEESAKAGSKTGDVSAVSNGIESIKLNGDTSKENVSIEVKSPASMNMKHGVGAVLRSTTMQRTNTGDSVEIIGDVIA